MRIVGLAVGLMLSLAPAALAADDVSSFAVGLICSAEHDPAPAGSERRLVMVAGVGTGGFAIRTEKPEAQQWFDYGMQLAHAFYHEDAKAAFRRAREIDPQCAMCAWGEAWADGPTINFDVSDAQFKAAAALADKAAILAEDESPKNRGLIAALQARYANHGVPAEVAFAKAMDVLVGQYPDDDEIAILTSDAWLIPWSLHQDKQGVARSVAVLEPVLARHPDNTGAIHFYIHATEENGEPAKALPYARRLGALAPGASHLVHMASHTFFRVGLYEEAAASNAAAIAADGAYLRAVHDASPQGKDFYHGHNLSFGLGGALSSGDAPLALRLADHAAFAFPGELAEAGRSQSTISHAWIAYARFAPDRALALPEPPKTALFSAAMRHYVRGEAFGAKGDVAGIRAEAAMVTLPAGGDVTLPPFMRGVSQSVVRIAQLTLQGRAAMLEGRPRDAVAAYQAAAVIEDTKLPPDLDDPPPWWFPEHRALAAALLAAGEPAKAAAEARIALKTWPHEPLTLQVLAEAERALGDTAGAQRDLAESQRGWRGGAVSLARM